MERYSRQVLFSQIGQEGQRQILSSHAIIVGCGALGTLQAESLARAGVGTLTIVDRDFVEESNLQRQTLFDEEDARRGIPKAVAAERRLKKINSSLEIKGLVEDVNFKNIERITEGADLILDGTDNFETRFLINDVAIKNKVPWIYGACVGSYGISATFVPGKTPCLRCLFPGLIRVGELPTCDTAGIIAPIVTIIASVQVCEALKLLSGNKDQLLNKLVSVDVWEGSVQLIDLAAARDAQCVTCAEHRFEFLQGKEGTDTVVLCGRNAVQINQSIDHKIELDRVAEKIKSITDVTLNEFLLKFNVDGYEVTVFQNGRGIVRGTNEVTVAKTIFSRYVGL